MRCPVHLDRSPGQERSPLDRSEPESIDLAAAPANLSEQLLAMHGAETLNGIVRRLGVSSARAARLGGGIRGEEHESEKGHQRKAKLHV